jgi:outer membrane receptor protein involved in Fe transport
MQVRHRSGLLAAAAVPALLAHSAFGQTAAAPSAPAPSALAPSALAPEQITVIGTSPLLGSGVDRNSIPVETQGLDSAAIARQGAPDVLGALNTQIAGINLDSASGNPYQPALFYNGFEASPLQGTSQGIAVYVNGVRFNQPFGDTINWDLIPDIAIAKLNVEGSNPLFGLNALGGSINVALKNGFTTQGGQADVSGGAFGTVQGDLEYGVQSGTQALYVAGSVVHEEGWRDLQSTDIQTFFGDYGLRRDGAEMHFDLSAANSVINGPGSAPIELLAVDSQAQFTAPNAIDNRYMQAAFRTNIDLTDVLSVQAQAYYDYFQQRVVNGNSPNDTPCDDGSNLLCQGPGMPSTTRGGVPIPAFLGNDAAYSELDTNTTNTNAYGAAAQFTDTGRVFGLQNHLVAGLSYDGAQTEFSATAFIGGLTPITRVYIGPGVVIDEPGNNVPVRAAISNTYGGGFVSDTLNLTQALAITLSGRLNFAEIDLRDQGGGDLTGNHAYARFNPAAGLTYQAAPWLTAYAGYAEANRAPTPAELSCAGPENSCSLANFFVGDPDLKQVVAHTVEAGLRGHFDTAGNARLGYDIGLFHTDSDDDIIFVNSVTLNRAFFANVGQTRRQGVSARIDLKLVDSISAYADYTYTDATFQTGYVESAGSNPAADANGNLTVRPGDALPGVPRQVLKLGVDGALTHAWRAGLDGQWQAGQYLFGDEANLTPRLPGFFVMNVHTSYDINPRFQLFASAQNVLDRRYYTFGTFSPTNSVFLVQAPNASNPRSYSLAAPLGFFGGVRVRF